jgi:2-enoate reductase
LQYLKNEVDAAGEEKRLVVHYETEVDNELLKEKQFDAVVFAIGTKDTDIPIPGKELVRTVQATELLVNPGLLNDAEKVLVVGGGVVGCETAYWLKYEHDKDVTVIEMLPEVMLGVCTANRGHLLHYMEKGGVKLYNCTRLTSFIKGNALVERNISKNVPDPYDTWTPLLPENVENPLAKKVGSDTRQEVIEADLIVLAMGGKANEEPFFRALKANVAPEIYNIGDSFEGKKVHEATKAGFRLARSI